MYRKIIFIFIILFGINSIYSQVFFEDDFEKPIDKNLPNPKWIWGSLINYGEGNIYSRSQDITHSGNYSLKLQFDGKNNWCNQCGFMSGTYYMQNGYSDVNYFVDSLGRNASNFFYNLTNSYAFIYNKGDNFSRWNVDYIDNDKIYFTNNQPVQNDMSGLELFNSGDEIKIPRVCGLDNNTYGGVYQDPYKKTDCDGNINYLRNVDVVSDFPLNGILTRRFYIYIPSNVILPEITFKLAYAHFKINGTDKSVNTVKLKPTRDMTLQMGIPSDYLSDNINLGSSYTVKRDRWYYFEEIWKRESSIGLKDGQYLFYFGEEGADVSQPVINRTNVSIGSLIDMSFHGNWQHTNEVSGSVYFDDFKISQNRSGPVLYNPGVIGTFPSIPKNLQAINVSSQSIEFNWSPSTDDNLVGYKIFRDNVEITSTTNNFYKDINLIPETNYSYFVQAYDQDNKIATSNSISFKTEPLNLYSGEINPIPFNKSLNKYLKGYWNFENYSSTHVFDLTNYSNSGEIFGTLIKNLTPISNTTNNYGVFDGVDDYIIYKNADELDLTGPFTFSFWVYPINASKGRILGKAKSGGFDYWFHYNHFSLSDNTLYVNFDDSLQYTLEENKWTNIVGVYDGVFQYLYINGFEVDKKGFLGPVSNSNVNFYMGARDSTQTFFHGYIDEVRIYNISLNPQDIFSLYLDPFNISFSNSSICGNNITETNETCDGTDLNFQTCQSVGFDSGTLSCLNTCQDFDTSLCSYNSVSTCGNNTIEGTEVCDGSDLNGTTCQSLGFDSGTLSCKNDCSGYITSSCSYDKNTGGGNGGGGGGSSSFCYSCIEEINITNTCIPLYQYSGWSDCIDNLQSRFVEDLNNCEGDDYEQRSCKIELSEEENLILNAKLLTLNTYANKKYKTSLDSGYNEIFYVEEQLEDNIFLLQDEVTGREYYGQYYDSIEDKHYYTLKRVDAGYITILQDEGILSGSLGENKNKENNLLTYLVIGFVIILFVGALVYTFYYFKKQSKI